MKRRRNDAELYSSTSGNAHAFRSSLPKGSHSEAGTSATPSTRSGDGEWISLELRWRNDDYLVASHSTLAAEADPKDFLL